MRKKKINRIEALLLVFILLGCLVLPLVSTVSAAEDTKTIYITSAEDFAKLAENCTLDTWSQGKTVVLKEDISLENAEVSTIPTFGGIFDGNGHTISGVVITQSITPSGLFGVLQEKAVIKNLKVNGSVMPFKGGENVGGIVGESYGMISGCTFTGSVAGGNNVGGIAGINAVCGQLISCNVSGSVTGDRMTGGIAGCNMGVIEKCRNGSYVNTTSVDPAIRPKDINIDFSLDMSKLSSMDTSTSSSDTGGIAGYSSGIVSGCDNNAPIGYPHIGYNIGGIVGRSCGYIYKCENNADIFGRKDVGGITGQMEPYIAQNISESTLAKLERQLDELDVMLDTVLNDTDEGVGTLTARLNRIADYTDSAAGAASDIRTYGSVTTTITGSGEAGGDGSATITPPQVEVEGSTETAGGAGAVAVPGGEIAGGAAVSEGEVQGGLTEGSAEGESSAYANGNVSADTQITMTTSLSGLSSALYGMSGQMRLLNGEISGTSSTLSEDMKAIQKQINEISDTSVELFKGEGEGDILIDSSEIEIDLVTLGKASDCKNSGSVNGDINIGGVAGAMAMEYELDPEDDIASNLDGTQRRRLEVKAIIQKCVNTGKIVAKRSYAGNICGRMDLGLIDRAEGYGSVISENGDYVGGIAGLTSSTIRHCFAKCTLAGKKNIGGIVGSGVSEDLSGDSSTVAGCFSMVNITSYQEFAGAVSGADAGNFVENYFVSDTLTGINGRSYTGKAEPITYAELLKRGDIDIEKVSVLKSTKDAENKETSEENSAVETTVADVNTAAEADNSETTEKIVIPDTFLQLTLIFVAEDEIIKTVSFKYGESFDGAIYPDIPEKDGYYAYWDKTELNDLHFDTVVTAVYIPYVSALSNTETRTNNRPIFFIEGQFDNESSASVTARPNTSDNFDILPKGWGDFLVKCFSGTTVSRDIVEQWDISIPDDGQETHTVRYLAPDGDPEHLDIYVKENNEWQKSDTEVIGSYLAFPVNSQEAEIAVISTMNVWWIWLIAGTLLLLLLLFIIGLIRKIVTLKKQKVEEEPDENDDEGSDENPDERNAEKTGEPGEKPVPKYSGKKKVKKKEKKAKQKEKKSKKKGKKTKQEKKKAKQKNEPVNQMKESVNQIDETSSQKKSGQNTKRRIKTRYWLLVVLALFAGVAGTAAFYILPGLMDDVQAYELLKKYSDKQELTMELAVDAEIDSRNMDFWAQVDRTNVDGQRITVISQNDRTLYYCNGVVFMENGNAYKLSESFPDYSQLLEQSVELYRHVDIGEKDGVYTITAEGKDAKAILECLIPSAAELLEDTNTIKVEMMTEEDEVSELHFSGIGTLADADKTPFEISAVLNIDSGNHDQIQIPQSVKDAVADGEYETEEVISDDLIRMAKAWQALYNDDSVSAKLTLKADCGPVTLNDSLDFYRWNDAGVQICSVRKNGYVLYFTDTAICDQNGEMVVETDTTAVYAARLLDMAYQICLNADSDCSETKENYIYSLSLNEDSMKAAAYALVPEAKDMDIIFDNGSIEVVICNNEIRSIEISCNGSISIILSSADVEFNVRMEFTEDMDEELIPEDVIRALER